MRARPLSAGGEAALTAVLVLGLVFALGCVPYMGTHDGPNHLANCVLANRLEDPSSPLHRWLELGAPITNLGFQHVCEIYEGLVGWRRGQQLTLITIALTFALGYFILARALDRGSPVKTFGFCAALSWPFFMGFFDFMLGMGLLLFALAGVVSLSGRRVYFFVAFATLLLASVHPFAAMTFGLITFLTLVLAAAPGRRWITALATSAAGIPGAALTLLARPENEEGTFVFSPFTQRAQDLADTFVGGAWFRAWPAAALAALFAGVGAAALFRRETPPLRRGVAVTAVALLAFFVVAPFHVPNWEYFSPRIGFTSLILAPLSVPPAWLERARSYWGAWVSTFLVSAVSLGGAALHNLRMAPLFAEALSGVDAPLARSGVRFPLFLDSDVSEFREHQPTGSIAHLYLFDQGGVDPFLYAGVPARDAILFKEKIEDRLPHWGRFPRALQACGEARSSYCQPLPMQHEWWTVMGKSYEDVLLFSSDPAVRAQFLLRGYAIDFAQGRLAILRPRRCELELEVTARGPLPVERLRFAVRRPPLDVDSVVLDVTARSLAAGPARITSPAGDCGPLELRIEPNPGESAGTPSCREAVAGRLRAEPRVGAPARVQCTIE